MKRAISTMTPAAILTIAAVAATAQVGSRPSRKARAANAPVAARRAGLAWSAAEGRPEIDPGRSVGFYLWHEGNVVHLVSTDEADKGQRFGGRITVQGGTIAHLQGIRLEKGDTYTQPKPNAVQFRFRTFEATDGLTFTLDGGKRIAFQLRYQGHPTQHIFVGEKAIEAGRDPVAFDLGR